MYTTHWKLIVLILVGVCLGLCGCNPNPQPEYLTPIPTLAPASAATLNPALQQAVSPGPVASAGMGQGNSAMGAAFYFKHCRTCHGLQGEGIDGLPLRNSQFIQTSGDDTIFSTIADGRSGTIMPAWFLNNGGPLDDAQISDIVAYLHTLQNVSPIARLASTMGGGEEAPPAAGEPPARPSFPGDPGPAATMSGDPTKGISDFGQFCSACHGPQGRDEVGYPNPGSDDGIVPPLNPIDPTLVDPDPTVFATNLDLFIEHGSIPSGPSPLIMMPTFGDSNLINDQQIADIIAYLMGLNGVK